MDITPDLYCNGCQQSESTCTVSPVSATALVLRPSWPSAILRPGSVYLEKYVIGRSCDQRNPLRDPIPASPPYFAASSQASISPLPSIALFRLAGILPRFAPRSFISRDRLQLSGSPSLSYLSDYATVYAKSPRILLGASPPSELLFVPDYFIIQHVFPTAVSQYAPVIL